MKFNLNNPVFLQMACGNARKENDYFYVTSLADANEVSFSGTMLGTFADNLKYSLNGKSWSPLDEDDVITLNSGESILFKNPKNTVYNRMNGITNVVKTSKEYEVGGNITELFYPGIELPDSAFYEAFSSDSFIISAANLKLSAMILSKSCYRYMFSGCTGLTAAPELPATILNDYCYGSMFSGCTGLTAAPELPAMTLSQFCYVSMFSGCTGLTAAPELPAMTLVFYCYYSMFSGCTGLTGITCLAEDISAEGCTEKWLENVSPSGTFIKSANMEDWQDDASGIPTGWTVQDYVG